VLWSNAKLDELSTSKYRPSPRELYELTMTFKDISSIPLCVRTKTDKLTASRKLDRRKLFLIVLLECRAKFRYKVRRIDRQSFDIYSDPLVKVFAMKGSALYRL
jgi:hypothetical protein